MRRREFIATFGGAAATAAWPLAIATSTSVLAAAPDWPKSLTLGTASPGGVYYVYGEELARILAEKLGIAVDPLPTQGPVHNVKLIDTGGAQLGFITMGVGLQGWNGTGDWTNGKQFRNMRALFPMYDTPFQALVLQRSGITTLAELDKKRIAVGPKAGTGGTYVPAILKFLGISAEIENGSFEAMATELVAGQSNALILLTGAPVPVIQDVVAKEPVTFISPSSEQIEAIRKAMPEFSPSKIAAGTYSTLDKDYATIGMYNFGVGRADLSDDLVYQLVKAVFENQPRLVKATSTASDTIPQNVVKNTLLPFHPGAVRYYREVGIKIPDALAATH
jgi:TRAP transporter TAXI family solute receptor